MIIDSIETLKTHIATIVGDNFGKYRPYLTTAETFLKREITGKDLFDLVAGNEDLLELCRGVVAHKAYLEAIPFLDLIETESGFAVTSNANLTPASTKRVSDLVAATEGRLNECIEDLLEWLEVSPDDIQDAWKGSKTYTLINDNYVSSIRQFRRYAEFAGGRLEWIRFRPHLVRARLLKIEPVISRELSEQIIEQLRDEELEQETKTANDKILEDLRFALAAFATGDNASGESFIARVRSVLLAKPDDYPLFKASSIYQAFIAEKRDASSDPFIVCGL